MPAADIPIIDAWIQHPTPAFIAHDMFASLRRWMRMDTIPDGIPSYDLKSHLGDIRVHAGG